MISSIYNSIVDKKTKKEKQFSVLIDPENIESKKLISLIRQSEKAGVDYFFVGGSLVTSTHLDDCILRIKENSVIPVVLFPGNPLQLSTHADGLLFLSLISGRNPEMLIGNHVIVAPFLKRSQLEIIPTGYMLIDGGKPTAVTYMSNTTPIPSDKNEIAVSTAIAGELLGLKLIYMDAGSGAKNPVSADMITAVRKNVNLPIIIGGGIQTPKEAHCALDAGADIVVVGNALENNTSILESISDAVHSFVLG